MRNALNLFGDLLWPRNCRYCGRDTDLAEAEICQKCWSSLVPALWIEKPKNIDNLWIAFSYDDRLRTIIHHYKFGHVTSIAQPLAQRMVKKFRDNGLVPESGYLVPVPDHPSRRRERGFNPAGLLAEFASEEWGIQYRPELAIRILAGPHQSMLPDEVRKTKLAGSFNFAICDDPERRLFLFDDVIHTGTTIKRLASSARKSGWKHIDAICLCV
ncbi:ComF family protein [Calditrichota bacterium]